MAVGKRIKYLRNLRGLTQKEFGIAVGFPERTADIRVAQYESEDRVPKEELREEMARVLDVSPKTLHVPDIDGLEGVFHTLLALEDLYGIQVFPDSGEIRLRIPAKNRVSQMELAELFRVWEEKYDHFKYGEISEREYREWCYNFNVIDKAK